MKVIVQIKSIEKTIIGYEFCYFPTILLTESQKCKVDVAVRKKVKKMIYPSWFWQKKVNVCDLIDADIEVEI